MFFETDKLLSFFWPDMLKLQELASKYESVKRTEHIDPETGIRDVKTEVIKPNKFANCLTDSLVYNRGNDEPCPFLNNQKMYS